jgi:translation initiation factor 5B
LIREPIVVVGGHVDHGKTTLLDYIRGTTVSEKESGRITQHIGATEVPIEVINRVCGSLLQKYKFNLTIPGLLFIDTPGHEAFSALRERGCNVANIAVLIIDIMQGCQPQTFEVVEFLRRNKTPFVVALTKIDSIKGYNSQLNMSDLLAEIEDGNTLFSQQFNEKFYKIIGQLGEKGFNSDRFDRVKDFTREILLIPVSSRTGKGIPELLLFLAGLSQRYLEAKLALDESECGTGTVLEVKEEKGFGKTIDFILCNGTLNRDDFIRIDSRNGVFVTKVKMMLKPKPLQEMRVTKERFDKVDKVSAALGMKIIADNIDNVVAGDTISVISANDAKCLETTN